MRDGSRADSGIRPTGRASGPVPEEGRRKVAAAGVAGGILAAVAEESPADELAEAGRAPARAPAAADPGAPLPFETTGPFRLVRRLGQGGFAPVYLAEEVHDGRKLRDVALKLFFTGAGAGADAGAAGRDRVLDEARALCRVEHPNVVRFWAVHRDDARGVLGLAMELVRGEGLDLRLRASGRLPDDEVLEAGAAVAWALSAVHDAGLVHGDVKPGNVVRGPAGYKLIDFGIATELDPRAPAPAAIAGTPGYLAPERLRGSPPSPAADLYALGALLLRLRGGAPPPAPDGPTPATTPFDAIAAEHPPPAGTATAPFDALAAGQPPPTARATAPFDALAAGQPRPVAEVTAPFDAIAAEPPVTAPFDALAAERASPPAHPLNGAPARPVPIERIPPAGGPLDDLIARLLAPDPHARPRHAAQVAREIEALRRAPQAAALASIPPGAPDPAPGALPSIHAAPAATTSAPAPALSPHPPLTGRAPALALLAAGAARAGQGRVQVTLIRGPLGCGRTRLLDEALAAAGLPAGRVLRGACSPERRRPLLPLLRALDACPRERLAAVQEAVEDAIAPGALRTPREIRAAVEPVEEALVWASAAEPLVLAIDDAQWADPHTLALLTLLAGRAREGGEGHLQVLAAVRDEPRPPAELKALLAAVPPRPDGATATIALEPLTDRELAQVARGVGPLSDDLLEAVVRGAGGVPFFLVHALFAWRDSGAIALRDGVFCPADPRLLEGGVPGVPELVEARLAQVIDPARRSGRAVQKALAAIALYGGGLPQSTLLEVCGDAPGLVAALSTLADMRVLVVRGARGEHGFAQEMVRQATRNLLRGEPWYLRLHRALLDTLARQPDADAAYLAAGYDALGAAEPARRWLERAMDDASRAGLLAEAVEMGARRAALAEDAEARAEAQLDTVRVLLAGRRFEEAELRLRQLGASVRRLPPRLDLRRRIHHLQAVRGLNAQASDPSLPADADTSGELALRCEARMAVAALAGGDRAVEIAGEAVALARGGDPSIEYAARVGRAELIYAADTRDLDLAHRDLSRALAIAQLTSSRLHRLQMESDLAVVEADRGDPGAAIERLARLASEAEAHGMRSERRRLVQNRAAMLLRAGRAPEAAEAASEAARLSREAGDPALCANAWSIRADALRRTGDLAEALASIDEALRLQSERGDRMRALSLLRRAEIAEGLGRGAEAERDAAEAREVASSGGERWIAIAAALWETLHRAREGRATAADVARALAGAEAPDVAPRALVRSLTTRARAWLEGAPGAATA